MKNISCFLIQRCGARLHHLFLILAVIPLFVNAQTYYPLVTEGKIWSVKHEFCKNAYPRTSEYVKFEGNVTINDTVYKQIWTSSDTVLHAWAGAGLIREDDQRRVWMRGLSNEKLLYDFGALPGDTLWLNDNPEPYVMGIIDSVMILTGEYRRQFHLIYPFPTCEETWIEGIGCLTGILSSGF